MKTKKLSIFSRFVLTGVFVFIVVGLILTSLVKPALLRLTFEQRESDITVFANRLAIDFLLPEDFRSPVSLESRERFERFTRNLPVPGIFRVKIWNTDGNVIYSDRGELIGNKDVLETPFRRALNFESTVQLEKYNKQNPRYGNELPFEESVLTHAPITFGSSPEVMGVLETLSRVEFLENQVNEIRILFTIRIVASLILIFAVLSFIVWGASRTVDNQRREIAKNLEQVNAILGSMADGVVAVEASGKIILMNKAAETMLGWSIKEAVGKKWHEILHREDEKGNPLSPEEGAIAVALKKAAITSSGLNPAYYYVRKNKTKFPVARTISPIVLNRKTIGAIAVFRDITEEKEVDLEKSEFVSLASHQLRTPLSAVNWYSELLLNEDVGKLNPTQKKYLDEIYFGNKRMINLVNDLLNVSRIELGTLTIEPEPTDVTAVADSVIKELEFRIKQKNLEVRTSYDRNIPKIITDPKLLRMVFQNLLSNATMYTDEGKITIEIEKDKSNLLVKVSDTGYGIPRHEQEKIFTKLFRAGNVKEKETTGSGLGLYISKYIIEQFRGKIWFESEENKGSTFYFTIPIKGLEEKK